MEILLAIGLYLIPLILLVFALLVGSILERRHFASIRQREQVTQGLPVVPTDWLDPERSVAETRLVTAGVVVSLDYFKRFLASFRNLVGGRVQSYESLLDRARREAILRLKEQVPDADIIVNLRIDTSNIANVNRGKRKGLGAVEVLAIGTAVRYVP